MVTIRISKIKVEKSGVWKTPTRNDIAELKAKIRHTMGDFRFRGLIDGRG